MTFLPSEDQNSTKIELAKQKADIWVTQIIFFLGVITILLGVINTTTRPAESYGTSSKFNNKFATFEDQLDLGVLELGGLPEDFNAANQKFLDFLGSKIIQLTELINEYNEARSLSPRQANIEAVNQIIDDKGKAIRTSDENSNVKDNNDNLLPKDSVISTENQDLKALKSDIN